MKNLTKRQTEIFNYIKDEIENNGYPPTRSEISKTFGFKSPNAAEDHLKALKKKGVLDLAAGTSRGITLSNQSSGIPVIGLVSAGGPILAEENIEKTIPNNPEILSHGVDFYLKVKGDSMVDAGIFEKNGMNKDVYINVVVHFGNGTKNQGTFSPKGAETLTIETLLNIPYVQNTHPGFVEIEVEEI